MKRVGAPLAQRECSNPFFLKLAFYTQPVGLGSPAYLHACFAGPAG